MSTIQSLSAEAQVQRWSDFKLKVLLPAITEMAIVNTPHAQTWKGGYDYQINAGPVIHIHNTRSCGWDYLPLANYSRPLFDFSTHNHYHVNARPNNVHNRNQQEQAEHKRDQNNLIAIAVVAACALAVVYTCYQMAHSLGQYKSSAQTLDEMASEYDSIKDLTILTENQRNEIRDVVVFRNGYLHASNTRSFYEIVQDIAIVAGLVMIAAGAAAGFAPVLVTAGTVMTAAGVIFKFQNPTKYPSLESSENRADASKVVEKARTLYQIDIHSQIEPHAPSEPYPEPSLYPDLSAMAQELGYFYNVEESAISFLPSAPPMEA